MFVEQDPLLRLPQAWESFGFFLPRTILNQWEIGRLPDPIPEGVWGEITSFWAGRKVALVKQTAYQGLYPESASGAWVSTVLQSGYHLGPFSVLADLGADYWVVRQEKEPETFLWREKYHGEKDPDAVFQTRMDEVRRIEEDSRRKIHRVRDIDWGQYDWVVGIDVPVPEKIVRSHPKTLWTYLSAEAGGPLHKNSLISPLAGYHLFLNQGFRRYRCRPRNRDHVLEFPFQFQSRRAWGQLRQAVRTPDAPRSILVGAGSWEEAPDPTPLPWDHLSGASTPAYLQQMFAARFAVHTTSRPRWGNWAIEAVQAGSLFLGNFGSLAHLSLCLPGLDCRTLSQAARRIARLLENPDALRLLQKRQADLAEHLAFRRPLADLTRMARLFFDR
jgi:hypothetical protein